MENISWERIICWFGEIKSVPVNKDNNTALEGGVALRSEETKRTLISVFQKNCIRSMISERPLSH